MTHPAIRFVRRNSGTLADGCEVPPKAKRNRGPAPFQQAKLHAASLAKLYGVTHQKELVRCPDCGNMNDLCRPNGTCLVCVMKEKGPAA